MTQDYASIRSQATTVSDAEIDELAATFDRDGYVVVPAAVSREDARYYRDQILGMLPSDLSIPLAWGSAYGRIKPLHENGKHTFALPELLPTWQNERLYRLAARLLGSERLRVHDGSLCITIRHDPRDRPLVQEASGGGPRVHLDTGVPRDLDRFRLDPPEMEVGGCYYFTDVAPGGGGIAISPGGHRWVAEQAAASPKGRRLYGNWGQITGAPPLVEVVGNAGDFVMHHYLSPHAVSHNLSETTRVVQFVRYRRLDNPYGLVPPVEPGTYDEKQLGVLTDLGRKLLGIDPWPDEVR
ncbi:phytanoyl-CoA dioxygenase family protein [Microbispora cellulosiformans]|uniref:Phytanoyl-CoA dioxygenase family protein n=1 Tax=Microbispora cellulosiformans TaxID=2614688 RepID=A0A5J5K8U1_9ACTN|nr:phytanoyl-CoA dioxygenase family protein [Microbispora cellulosiformans]KAA9381400.1 phytanoyl-CoA dioxygenase family protein [Microbispora cellulosiformans]